MKKTILKSALVAVAAAASCFGAWKAYASYGKNDYSILIENVEALSNGDYVELKPIWVVDKTGFCFQYVWNGATRVNPLTGKREYYYEAQAIGGINNTWATCKRSASVAGIDKCTKHDCLAGEPYDNNKEGWKSLLNYKYE